MSPILRSYRLWEEPTGSFNSHGLLSSGAAEKDIAWHRNFMDLYELFDLEDNWDGEDAEAPSIELIENAISYLNSLQTTSDMPAPSRVIFTQDEEIVVEWNYNNNYLELTIAEPYKAEWMIVDPIGNVQHSEVDLQPQVDPWQQFNVA
ncbi:MAG: hypothetical protein OQK73_03030 [Gammaproteobacteria bacterium]|nr:hypothetical protein [Gammaproteobacteria bacterium]